MTIKSCVRHGISYESDLDPACPQCAINPAQQTALETEVPVKRASEPQEAPNKRK